MVLRGVLSAPPTELREQGCVPAGASMGEFDMANATGLASMLDQLGEVVGPVEHLYVVTRMERVADHKAAVAPISPESRSERAPRIEVKPPRPYDAPRADVHRCGKQVDVVCVPRPGIDDDERGPGEIERTPQGRRGRMVDVEG